MLDVAEHSATHNVTLKDISKRQAISEKYLWQIVRPLKAAGLIRTILGPGGGYALAREASQITLNDILAPLEGEEAIVPCVQKSSYCIRSHEGVARDVWKELSRKLTEVLQSMSLEDILQKQKNMTDNLAPMYCI